MEMNRRQFFKATAASAVVVGASAVPVLAKKNNPKKKSQSKLREEYVTAFHEELPKGEVASYKKKGRNGWSLAHKTNEELFVFDGIEQLNNDGENVASIRVLYKKDNHTTDILVTNFSSGLEGVRNAINSEAKIAKRGKGRPVLNITENGLDVADRMTRQYLMYGMASAIKALKPVKGDDVVTVSGKPPKGNSMSYVLDGNASMINQVKSMHAAWIRANKQKTM